MSNRKYPRLSDGYHDRSPYHPYQTKKQANCIADSRDRDRSPSGSNSKDNSPYFSNRHSNSQRSKFSYSRSKDGSKKGSSQSPKDSNSHLTERRTKFNHSGTGEEFPWSQHVSSSGKVYYYNFKTEKSQWEKPKEWIERERREKEGKDRIRSSVSSKDTGLRKDDTTYEKSRTYASKYSFKDTVNDKRDSNRVSLEDRGRENHKIAESDRGQMVIKTVSAHTSAQSTASHRSTPLAAVNSDVSPVGSLQDVSPPSTPSSRASLFDTGSHTSSPQLVSVSPLSTPYQNSQSPLGLSRHGVLLQVSSSSTVNSQYSKPLHSMAQPHHNSTQYGLVNNGNSANMLAPSQLKTSYDSDTNSRPVLHPLQQATLLHQKKLSESRNHAISNYQQPFLQITQPTIQTVAAAHLKDSNRINQSPGSPIISSQNTKEQFQSLSHVQTSNSSQISPSSVSPVPLQPSPVVNLQALAKYVDKSLTNHTINWPTEAMDKQVQRLNDEGYSSSSDASKVQIQQLHLNSQLDLLDITLNVGSKRISSMKEVTKTLEKLLAESDKKSLT